MEKAYLEPGHQEGDVAPYKAGWAGVRPRVCIVGSASRRAAGREKSRRLGFDNAVSVGTKINIDFVFMWSQIVQRNMPGSVNRPAYFKIWEYPDQKWGSCQLQRGICSPVCLYDSGFGQKDGLDFPYFRAVGNHFVCEDCVTCAALPPLCCVSLLYAVLCRLEPVNK
jgi:hypothetical protein